MTNIAFTKMHGLGNDFVIIDTRNLSLKITTAGARALADRHTGIGFDQLILLDSVPVESSLSSADIFMHIYNADGSNVEACGNATRCVADLILARGSPAKLKIGTRAGILKAERLPNGMVTVDMGKPKFNWKDIPLSEESDTLYLDIQAGTLKNPTAVNIGNPHCVFFVDNAEIIPLETLGQELEFHVLFPKRVNIGIVEVKDAKNIRLRVWERGAGITQACGTAACAAAISAHRRDLAGREVLVELDGGLLNIQWRADDHVIMTGPTATSFTGSFNPQLIGA